MSVSTIKICFRDWDEFKSALQRSKLDTALDTYVTKVVLQDPEWPRGLTKWDFFELDHGFLEMHQETVMELPPDAGGNPRPPLVLDERWVRPAPEIPAEVQAEVKRLLEKYHFELSKTPDEAAGTVSYDLYLADMEDTFFDLLYEITL
jgi:hypothetical protein